MKKEIKKIVYTILEKDYLARIDDNYLIGKVVAEIDKDILSTNFESAIKRISEMKISFESITRARRKFLEEFPEFRDPEITLVRQQEEENYFMEYSRHIPRIN